jgi:hypothetical protein
MMGMGALLWGGFSTIPGSTPFGGQITPLDSASRSLSGALPVVSPERGGGDAPSGGQSGLVDGAVGVWLCPYKDEVEDAATMAAATATFFKLCMVVLQLKKHKFSILSIESLDQRFDANRVSSTLVNRQESHGMFTGIILARPHKRETP